MSGGGATGNKLGEETRRYERKGGGEKNKKRKEKKEAKRGTRRLVDKQGRK